ncbi:MAG: CHAT domain-containing protein [Candidatus Thiodiazotropha sp. 6PLUC2]
MHETLNIFLSYASSYRELADDLCCRLQAVGHEVFFDREDLLAGTSFDDRIRQAIDAAELFIFLVSPEAVAKGHYTRTELKLAARKWPTPGWHVLPVLVAETPLSDIPAYLRALTLMQAEGNLTAEVVMEVEDRERLHGADTSAHVEVPTSIETPKSDRSAVRYRSLQLHFDGDVGGGYGLSVPDAPSGRQGRATIALDPTRLETALWANARTITGSARRAGSVDVPPALLPGAAAARQIGEALYAALISSDAGRSLEESMRGIDPQRGDGLRFVINTTDAPALARLPWEFLYSPKQDDFLFSDRLKPVVRWLDVDEPSPTLTVEPPLRMLMVIAAPADRPELAIGEELAHLDRALEELSATGVLTTLRLEHITLETLDNALLKHRPHVLHFIGHGDFVDDEGVLVLESDRHPGTAETIAGRQLAVLLRNYRDCLRLVFLNSCMGATASNRDPFGGVAQSLIRRGIPAVIAMQFPIPDEAAIALSRHFYRYLAAGQPVDAALSSARAFLYARGYPVEWGAPALHMRTPDGRLFDLAPSQVVAPPSPPPPEPTVSAPSAPMTTPPPKRTKTIPLVLFGLVVIGTIGAWVLWPNAVSENKGTNEKNVVIVGPPSVEVETAEDQMIPKEDNTASEDAEEIVEGHENAAIEVETAEDQPNPEEESADYENTDESVEVVESAAAEVATGSDDFNIDLVISDLSTDEAELAVEALTGLLETDPDLLTRERLGERYQTLVDGLFTFAEASGMDGNEAQYESALALLHHLEPGGQWHAIIDSMTKNLAYVTAAGGAPSDQLRYIARPGDSLWSIAQRFYGDSFAWPRLMERHNRLVSIGMGGEWIANPDMILQGQWIHVPTSPDSGAETFDYHVIRGDTLSGIAWRVYGDASLWPQIAQDNAAQITNPAQIRPGQVLVIIPRRR